MSRVEVLFKTLFVPHNRRCSAVFEGIVLLAVVLLLDDVFGGKALQPC